MTRLPFTVDCNSRLSFTEQIADGLRRAIEAGFFKVGDVLPTLDELVELTGVSSIVVRGAVRRLVKDGLVNPRPGIGSVVLGRHDRLWQGRVLIVTTEFKDNNLFATMIGILREDLIRAGYQPWQVSVVQDESGRPDFGQLDLVLRETFSLVVLFGARWGVEDRLRKTDIPYVVLGGSGPNHVGLDLHAGLPDFAAHCRSAGVRSVLCPVFIDGCEFIARTLSQGGLDVALWRLPYATDLTRGDKVQFGAYEAFRDRLAQNGRDWLPDVLYFADDYAVVGALLALDEAGIRVPEDVGVVAWRAVGNGPCYRKALTRLETDPDEAGRRFAGYVLKRLDKRNPDADRAAVCSEYVEGETFPASGGRKGKNR